MCSWLCDTCGRQEGRDEVVAAVGAKCRLGGGADATLPNSLSHRPFQPLATPPILTMILLAIYVDFFRLVV